MKVREQKWQILKSALVNVGMWKEVVEEQGDRDNGC